MENNLLKDREAFVCYNSKDEKRKLECDGNSVSGSVSQRACVYCGARVVLNPITDAFHIVHGPIGCASYTWDIRGSLSSESENYRNSYSTDLKEKDIIFGGEKKLSAAIHEIVAEHNPKVIFIYCTCIVGVIGDDVDAVCREAERKYNIRVIAVKAPGFSGNKSTGYKTAGNALLELMDKEKTQPIDGINILGDFNLAGEMWILTNYLRRIGVNIVSRITGDSTSDEIKNAPNAKFNVVQCAGSMTSLAMQMEEKYDIPFIKVSFYGLEDVGASLTSIAEYTKNPEVIFKTKKFINEEMEKVKETIAHYKKRLKGKKAAIYVGGGFKAISLIKQFNELGIETVMVGTQTGRPEEYEIIKEISNEGTVILDDSNPSELEKFIVEKGADILVGGVKERPLAYKLGIAFCDHNHERKHALSGYEGAINFAKEIDITINSPIWKYL
jgi:nitrogenase molybdenum-cofactor synthesis protein NifE